MGDGTKENPYTREDVLRLIKENGDTAKGLVLSHKVFVEAIDLNAFHLEGIHLFDAHLKKAHLMDAHLENAGLGYAYLKEAHLMGTNLECADLERAQLQGAGLTDTNIKGADLSDANLEGAYLLRAEFSHDTNLNGVYWGNFIIGEEREGEELEVEEREYQLHLVVDIYRRLKLWYTEHGIYDVAGKFFFREITAKRKTMDWWPKPWNRAFSKLISILCGYGEKPERVVISAATVILIAAFIYFLAGSVLEWSAFWSSLYFSMVSFTALGYGSWVGTTSDWIRGLGAAESFLGVFMMALFIVTFVRKMTR